MIEAITSALIYVDLKKERCGVGEVCVCVCVFGRRQVIIALKVEFPLFAKRPSPSDCRFKSRVSAIRKAALAK